MRNECVGSIYDDDDDDCKTVSLVLLLSIIGDHSHSVSTPVE